MALEVSERRTTGEEGMVVSGAEYERIVLASSDVKWELHHGRLREKPGMSVGHNRSMMRLGREFLRQLDEEEYEVRIDMSRVLRPEDTYYIPDLFVVPPAMVNEIADRPDVLEVFPEALPLVVEVWSPSTGNYDVESKLPEYQRRGDVEIWRVHPYERTLTIWRRRPAGGYARTVVTGGLVRPVSLPGVEIDLDALFR